ncbi:hypothetical protein LLG95_12975 [bacterium]|nr:hypothetical protein [bacterium]
MIVFEDNEAREATLMVTLSHKAGWTLAKLMAAFDPPLNLERMEADGIEPQHFADASFSEQQLLNRRLKILVEKGRDEKYPEVTPVISRPKPAEQPPQHSYGNQPPQPPTPPPAAPLPQQAPPVQQELIPPAPIRTEEEAWAQVLKQWPGCDTDADKTNARNNSWFRALQDINKPKQQFTPSDWQRVVMICTCPF